MKTNTDFNLTEIFQSIKLGIDSYTKWFYNSMNSEGQTIIKNPQLRASDKTLHHPERGDQTTSPAILSLCVRALSIVLSTRSNSFR